MKFDWSSEKISRTTEIDLDYRNTQIVRRFLTNECGPDFKFSLEFTVWFRNGNARDMVECRRMDVQSFRTKLI